MVKIIDPMPGEEWRPVPGYEQTYLVSSLGRIQSLPRGTTAGRIMRQQVGQQGYPMVTLCQDAQVVHRKVHRLVALAFLGPVPDGQEVRHKDGDCGNPQARNLCYGTRADNTLDMVAHGRHNNARKTHCKWGHEFTPENTLPQSRNNGRRCRACKLEEGRRPA